MTTWKRLPSPAPATYGLRGQVLTWHLGEVCVCVCFWGRAKAFSRRLVLAAPMALPLPVVVVTATAACGAGPGIVGRRKQTHSTAVGRETAPTIVLLPLLMMIVVIMRIMSCCRPGLELELELERQYAVSDIVVQY